MAKDRNLFPTNPAAPNTAQPGRLWVLAEIISTATNPAIVFIASLAFITYRYADSTNQFLRWTAIGTLLLVGPGMAYTMVTWRREHRVDIDITKREKRLVPLLLSSLGALFGTYLISSRLDNPNLMLMGNVLVAMLVVLTIITFQWKVSLHTSTFAALTTLLAIFASPYFVFLFLGVAVVGWARVYLRQHTTAQVIGGGVVGATVTLLITLLFRS